MRRVTARGFVTQEPRWCVRARWLVVLVAVAAVLRADKHVGRTAEQIEFATHDDGVGCFGRVFAWKFHASRTVRLLGLVNSLAADPPKKAGMVDLV